MRIDELIAQIQPLEYKWVNEHMAIFMYNGTKYAITLGIFTPIQLERYTMRGITVAFGVVDEKSNISTDLTGLHKPRTIIATVAHALIEKFKTIPEKFNYIVLAAKADAAMAARARVYRAAIIDVADQIEQTGFHYPYEVEISGSAVMLITRMELTPRDVNYLVKMIERDANTD